MLHTTEPSTAFTVVIRIDHLVLELRVQIFGIHFARVFLVQCRCQRSNAPTGFRITVVRFDPPTIECGDVDRSIECSFHPTGTRSFHQTNGCVEPHIGARREKLGKCRTVVGQVDDFDRTLEFLAVRDHVTNHFLREWIMWVCIPGMNYLQFATANLLESFNICIH